MKYKKILLLTFCYFQFSSATLWTKNNCLKGQVTDAVCCNDFNCQSITDQEKCGEQHTCLWYKDKCQMNRDSGNSVCCQSKVNEQCDEITRGICPKDWQVDPKCCSKSGLKYKTILKAEDGQVCCNTPCKDAKEIEGCQEKEVCRTNKISGRSYSNYGIFGFRKGLFPEHNYHVGQVIPGLGFPYHEGGYHPGEHFPGHSLHDNDYSKDKHVDEITADDLINSLITALASDKDVFTFNEETTSDPYFRKETFGGLIDTFNFVNPEYFVDDIYGLPHTYGYNHHGRYGGGGHGYNNFGHHGYGGGHRGGYGYGGGHQGGYGNPYGGHHGSGKHHGYGSSNHRYNHKKESSHLSSKAAPN